MVDVGSRLDGLRNALEAEPRLLNLDQSIKDATLLNILAEEIDNLEPDEYINWSLTNEVSIDVFFFLRFRQLEVPLDSKEAALEADIAFLEEEAAKPTLR
jgi:hypothetical protein